MPRDEFNWNVNLRRLLLLYFATEAVSWVAIIKLQTDLLSALNVVWAVKSHPSQQFRMLTWLIIQNWNYLYTKNNAFEILKSNCVMYNKFQCFLILIDFDEDAGLNYG
jgi:hypothetical protein